MGNYISNDQNVNFVFATINEKFLLLHKLLLDIKNLILKGDNTNISNINIIINKNNADEDGFIWDNYEIDNLEEANNLK
tara:strand:- start:943 stop:1179 length:237 start_codon:yes stop_codon:yes gene_type:complete